MNAPTHTLLSRLNNVKQTGPGRWMACCPGPLHKRGDKHPSLSVREVEDGKALVYCPVGCGATDIMAALGLSLADLFPPREPSLDGAGHTPKAPPLPWRDIFQALQTDLSACALAFGDLARGKPFSPEDAAFLAEKADDLAFQLRRARNGY